MPRPAVVVGGVHYLFGENGAAYILGVGELIFGFNTRRRTRRRFRTKERRWTRRGSGRETETGEPRGRKRGDFLMTLLCPRLNIYCIVD